ncbi:rho guanine nucleotide exchange factor 18a isoform X2 [Neoarius graeffei]|uniref:rho guanine nucleotide exchange factor 18a isoform X2 n=1 Tax=Neoarius graeffei TaxID=443677 RepID=UPI00298BE456|nr:rho guanine nucleotide exchange factor 18a isoform X2 [Neoarius graeffei]
MEESDQLRPKSVLDELTVDGINIEDVQYLALREDLESDARDFEAPTWSLSVDQLYVKSFSKDAVKRQDVIHELIQTEINHVRTLKLMLSVYQRELQDSLLMDESQLERLFPRLDHLLHEHQNFLQRLKNRRRMCLEAGSDKNYCISNIGDILITQFSGDLRSRLQDSYGVFCSRHTEAVNLYKELQNNKKFQSLIRRIGQLSIVRRLGVPEGILLITQRITKYPVLVERIIKNTEADTQEYEDLLNALECIKDTISTINTQVHQYEQLREIAAHLDPKSFSRMSNGKTFRRDDLLQNDRKLLREGRLTWRPQNRSKVLDVIMVLLPDLLLLLQQEKDQKYIFASQDGKPAVLPLSRLIVREAAHSDLVMYLISASDVKAELYEFHTSTAEERHSWRQQIWETIEKCPHVDEELMEHENVYPEKLQALYDQLCKKDGQIEEILRQKLQIISDLSEVSTENSTTVRRLLLRGSAPELLQGELLINTAIRQAEYLQKQLIDGEMNFIPRSGESDDELRRRSQTLPGNYRMTKSGDGFRSRDQRPNSDPHLRDLYLDPLEVESVDDDDDEGCSTLPPPPAHTFKAEWIESADKVIRTLYSLKALVSQQDTELEVLRAAQSERDRSSRQRFSSIQDQERQRHLEKQREDLLHLQKIHIQQKQQQEAWAREHQRHLLDIHEREQELKCRMEECAKQEAWLCAERDVLSRRREEYQQDLERLRDSTRTVEKNREKLEQDVRRFIQHKGHTNQGGALHAPKLAVPYSSDDMLSNRSLVQPGLLHEHPPLVPPRRESMSVTSSAKADVPIQLVSTTNQALKPSSVQQQIPTKLAISKGKEKSKSSHHRTNSAASIEVSEVFPIKVSGKDGGSLRAMKTMSRTHAADVYPELTPNLKPPHSANTLRKSTQPQNHQRTRSGNQEDIFFF